MAKSTVVKPDVYAAVMPMCYVAFDRATGPDSSEHHCYSGGQVFSCPKDIFRLHTTKKRKNLRKATPAEIEVGYALPMDERDRPVAPVENEEDDPAGENATV